MQEHEIDFYKPEDSCIYSPSIWEKATLNADFLKDIFGNIFPRESSSLLIKSWTF